MRPDIRKFAGRCRRNKWWTQFSMSCVTRRDCSQLPVNSAAHILEFFVTVAALRRMGIDAYAVRTLSDGGPLSTLLAQVAHEADAIRVAASA